MTGHHDLRTSRLIFWVASGRFYLAEVTCFWSDRIFPLTTRTINVRWLSDAERQQWISISFNGFVLGFTFRANHCAYRLLSVYLSLTLYLICVLSVDILAHIPDLLGICGID